MTTFSLHKNKRLILVMTTLLLTSVFLNAQVAINTTGNNPAPSAMFDVTSTSKGILIPRTSTDSITSPANGLIIYDMYRKSLMIYNGTTWVAVQQTLNLSGNTLAVSGGNNVDLSGYLDNTDAQILNLSGDTLYLQGGNYVHLARYLDNSDTQNLSLSSNTLSLTNDATTVDLSGYLDNTDAQTLSLSNDTLLISGGNKVKLPSIILKDEDEDTKIQVEESTDEDIIRMDVAGVELLTLQKTAGGFPRLNLVNGSENTIIGNFAGQFISSGYSNILIGRDAGKFGTTMNRCVFIGQDAGESNSTGIGCTFIGNEAGDKSNANYNTFIGAWSGLLTTSGGDNTFIGQDAGLNNNTGGGNTYLGKQAGYSNVSGSGNVFIGREAGYSEIGSNKLYISNSITATPLIWGDFSTGKIGLGRAATTNTLEVEGEASKSSAGDWIANSDARLKKDIEQLDGKAMLEKLLSMKGVSYEWNDDQTGTKRPTGTQYGFIAQDIQKVFPKLVKEDAKGWLQTAYGTYDAMYVEAIRTLNQELTDLKAENEALRSQITAIWTALEKKEAENQAIITKN